MIVYLVINDYGDVNGGASNIAIGTALGLAERHHVAFFCAVDPKDQRLLNSHIEVISLGQQDINNQSFIKGGLQLLNNRKASATLNLWMKKHKKDRVIVLIHGWHMALSSSIFRIIDKYANATSFITLHDYFLVCPNGGLYDFHHCHICKGINGPSVKCLLTNCDKKSYIHKIYRWIRFKKQWRDTRNAKRFFYISELNKAVFQEHWSRGQCKLFSLPNFVAQPSIKANPVASKTFLYIGRLSEEKGVDAFCESLAKGGFKGIVIGDGPKRESLEKKFPNVEFVGWLPQKDIWTFVCNSRALVFPTKWYEGAPLTIIEMLSCGLPCIVSNCSSAIEFVHDGQNGLVYDGTVEQLISCMERMSDDSLAQKLSRNIETTFDVDRFSLKTHMVSLEKILDSVCKGEEVNE